MVKKILIGVAIIIVVAVAVGLYMYNKPQKDYTTSKPDFVLTVDELFNAFVQDEAAATQKFVAKNSTIQVSGLLHDIVHEADSTITLILKSPHNDEAFVNCNLASSKLEALATIKPGETITIKGQCTGYQGLIDKAVYMIRSTILEE
jgi:hypothetical protein